MSPRSYDNAEAVVSSNKDSMKRFDLSFPKDMGEHGLLMEFSKYSFGSLGEISGQSVGSVLLPIPSNISESYAVNIEGAGLGLTGALGAEALSGNINAGNMMSSIANTGNESLLSNPTAALTFLMQSGFAGVTGAVAGGVASGLVGGTVGAIFGNAVGSSIGDAASVASGTALNPHTTVMFKGMNLRSHNFHWNLSPRSASEGETLRKIIQTIKRNSLPSYQSAGGQPSGTALDRVLLRYPNVVDLSFVGLDQSYFYKFKTCMITQIEVDYSTSGNAFFAGPNGSKPVMVRFSLSLMESKIHTTEDFESGE